MKKFPILFLFLFLGNFLYAQHDIAQYDVLIPGAKEIVTVSDDKHGIAYILQSNRQYQITTLNHDLKQDKRIIVKREKADKREEILGGTITGQFVTVYLYNTKTKIFSALKVDKKSGAYSTMDIGTSEKNDQFLKAFNMNGKFYVLSVPRTTNSLKIYTSENGSAFILDNYFLEMPAFYERISKDAQDKDEIESDVDIQEVTPFIENNVKSTHSTKKLYHFNNTIFLTFDEPGSTHLLAIQPDIKKSSYKKMNFTLEKGNDAKNKQGNSFLHHDKFFRVTISPAQLNLTVLDLDSMKLVNTYNVFPEKDIEISNGPIIQEGSSGAYATDDKIIKKTTQFFNRAIDGNLAVAVNQVDSLKYALEIGSFEQYEVRSGGNGFGPPGVSLGMGMGGGIGVGIGSGGGFGYPMNPGYGYNSYPGYPGYYSPGSGTVRTRAVYFKSLLQDDDFKHSTGSVPKTLREKLNDYEEGRFRNGKPELQTIVSYKDKVYLGYLKRNNKYQLVEFKR